MGNKVQYNLRNVHYAPIKEEAGENGWPTYDTPRSWPGAVELSMDAQGSISKFYADGIVFWQSAKNNGYEGDLTMAQIPDKFRADCLGEKLADEDKVYLESVTDKGTPFALLFEFEGDAQAVRHVLYNCTATRPSLAGKTSEEETTPDTQALTISAAALPNGYVKARTGDETPTQVVAGWYDDVYIPGGEMEA